MARGWAIRGVFKTISFRTVRCCASRPWPSFKGLVRTMSSYDCLELLTSLEEMGLMRQVEPVCCVPDHLLVRN